MARARMFRGGADGVSGPSAKVDKSWSLDPPATESLGGEIMGRAEALAACSEPGAGVTRRFATAQHRAANELIVRWMREAGMRTWIDAAGNAVGRYEGRQPGRPTLMFGSHQDSVRCGGRYDGMLGILVPISCVKSLHEAGVRTPFAIEIIAFGDEEGLRFQTTLLGSRAVAGSFDMAVLEQTDEAGITVAEAMREFRLEPDQLARAARRPEDVLAFVEVHIEQGPQLESRELPVGVVSAIAGCTRLQVDLTGTAGHAGTTPMGHRRDALAAAAEAVLAVERCSMQQGTAVGTVGKLTVAPGAINVIPGKVSFTADIRAPEEPIRRALVDRIVGEIRELCERRGVVADTSTLFEAPGCACTPWVVDQLAKAVAAEGIEPLHLFSGAGHDTMAMADLTSVGMLFVRCERGISHRPDEAISVDDAGIAARTLLRFISAFTPA